MRCPPPPRKFRFSRVDSTGSCCCIVLSAVLASNRMLNFVNTMAEPKRRFDPRLASGQAVHFAFPLAPSRITSTISAKLDFSLTCSNQSTSQFLIDNFCSGSDCSSLVTRHLSLPSNRPSPRLEILVNHRRQRIGPISNRPKFAVCKFHCSSFLASSPLLIANDMHSHEESSTCKQSTYQILIANEFHYLQSTTNVLRGSLAASSQGLGIQVPLAQQNGLRPAAIRYNKNQAMGVGEAFAPPGRTHGISYRAAA